MVRLATARESRSYGPRQSRNRWEYINAGLYVFSVSLLAGGLSSLLLGAGAADAMPRLVTAMIGLAVLAAVNLHDLLAHLAAVDFCLLEMAPLDPQLALVEFAAPLVELSGTFLFFAGTLLLLIQWERGYNERLEKHASNLLIAGPALWLLGAVHDICQVYERAHAHLQIIQKSVQIPLFTGSLLFLVGGVFNKIQIFDDRHQQHYFTLASRSWVCLCSIGSVLFFAGGLLNVAKVFKMQQMDGIGVEKLRGGAAERLSHTREGRVPLILEESGRRKSNSGGVSKDAMSAAYAAGVLPPQTAATPYKDVLIGHA